MVGGYTSAWATRQGMNFIVAVAFGIAVAAVIAFAFAWMARRGEPVLPRHRHPRAQRDHQPGHHAVGPVHGRRRCGAPRREADRPLRLDGDVQGPERRHQPTEPLLGVPRCGSRSRCWSALDGALAGEARGDRAPRPADGGAAASVSPPLRLRLTMFVLGSAIGAFAGALSVHGNGYAQPTDYTVELGLGIFVMLIVGGIDSLWGPVLGAAFYVWLPHFLQRLDLEVFGHQIREYNQIIYGAVLLLTMIFMPEGLVGIGRRARARLQRRTSARTPDLAHRPVRDHQAAASSGRRPRRPRRRRRRVPPPAPRAAVLGRHGRRDGLLRADGHPVNFGGVVAVDGVSLDMSEGRDPRPGGSERQRQDHVPERARPGSCPAPARSRSTGNRCSSASPAGASGGVLRTYQAPQTYDHLICMEDVLLSTADRQRTGILPSWFLRPSVLRHERERWRSRLRGDRAGRARRRTPRRRPGGSPTANDVCSSSPAPSPRNRRCCCSTNRRPVSTTRRPRSSSGYLHDLRDEGVSLFVIDHKLDFITGLCDRVAVLELGHLVAVGDAATVFQDQRVVDAYLGVAEVD